MTIFCQVLYRAVNGYGLDLNGPGWRCFGDNRSRRDVSFCFDSSILSTMRGSATKSFSTLVRFQVYKFGQLVADSELTLLKCV
jgi:hypothetical protein